MHVVYMTHWTYLVEGTFRGEGGRFGGGWENVTLFMHPQERRFAVAQTAQVHVAKVLCINEKFK